MKRDRLEARIQIDTQDRIKINKQLEEEVNELKQKAEDLRISEAKYRQLVNSMIEGLWLLDKNGKTTFVNPAMAQMLDYREDEMVGKFSFDFVADNKIDEMKRYLEILIQRIIRTL